MSLGTHLGTWLAVAAFLMASLPGSRATLAQEPEPEPPPTTAEQNDELASPPPPVADVPPVGAPVPVEPPPPAGTPPDEAAVPAPPAANPSYPPSFATLDRVDGRSLIGIEAGYASLDQANAQRMEVYGQAVKDTGPLDLGGYAAASFARQSWSDGYYSFANHGMGNLESGFIAARKWLGAFRVGLVYPYTTEGGGSANMTSGALRPTDLVRDTHDYTWMRISVSPILRSGQLFMRFDLGVDLNIRHREGIAGFTVFRGNLGVGWEEGPYVITGELVNVLSTEGNQSLSFTQRLMHTLAVSGRYTIGWFQPFLAYLQPLDEGLRHRTHFLLLGGTQIIIP